MADHGSVAIGQRNYGTTAPGQRGLEQTHPRNPGTNNGMNNQENS
jgi:hypothetical protein